MAFSPLEMTDQTCQTCETYMLYDENLFRVPVILEAKQTCISTKIPVSCLQVRSFPVSYPLVQAGVLRYAQHVLR